MISLYATMWLTGLAFVLFGIWVHGYLSPRGLDEASQVAMELAAARTRQQRCDAERIRLNAKVAEIEPQLEKAHERLERAERRAAELAETAAAASDASAPSDAAALAKQVRQLKRDLAGARKQAAEARAADDLRRQLDAARREIVSLRDAAAARIEAETATPAEERPAEGEHDDLTRIKGVGPKLAAALNAQGVYYFHQIASWNAARVAEFDATLPLPGRIARDGWVAQARALAEGR